jgi:hypothetical protein
MSDKRAMLRHFLGAIAYRTQKVLRDGTPNFGEFRAGRDVRTPTELVRPMTNVLGYARTHFVGGRYSAQPLPSLAAEVERFHEILVDLAAYQEHDTEICRPLSLDPVWPEAPPTWVPTKKDPARDAHQFRGTLDSGSFRMSLPNVVC